MRLSFTLLLAVLASGCGNLGYYTQSARGQLDLMSKREPIAAVIARAETPEPLRAKLEYVLRVRDFASRELKLPDNGSYRSYADLQREHVVWNVFAAAEFSLELREWCFLFAGCVRYRGYFSPDDANALAAELRAQGSDVYVAGIDAYSTLGWFDDPVLNTFVQRSDSELAGLLFHELAHQRVYIPNDTVFNESFARTVEIEGVRRWFAHIGKDGDVKFQKREERQQQFYALVGSTRDELKKIYDSNQPDADKRAAKARVFDAMRARYAELKAGWNGYDGYDKWFARQLNNAQLGSVSAYTERVPAFTALFNANDGDFERFYRAVEELGELPDDARNARLDALSGVKQ